MSLHKSYKSLLTTVAIALVIVTAGAQSAHSETGPEAAGPKETQDFAPGRILVKAEERAPASAIGSLNRENDAHVEEKLPGIGVSVIEIPKDLPVAEAVKRYENAPGIEYAEPDYEVQPEVTPSDPSYPRMYALNNTGQVLDGTPDADIDAPEAWSVTTGSTSTVVAVIDSGVDISHPDLNDNIWTNPDEIPDNGIDDDKNGYVDDVHGWDFFNNNASVFDAADGDRHGTHVAGTIAAEGNNDVGVTGVNWRAKVMPLKFIGPEVGYTSGAIAALDYAVAEGVKVSNNSWGRFPFSQSMLDAIKRADAAGHLFVASAGNAGVDTDATPHYPSGYDSPNVVSVAASDQNDSLAVFSNANGASNYGTTSVDLAAPGDYILSTTPGNTYSYFEGTSMAAPHVAGVAALVKAQYPALDDAGIKIKILSSVDKRTNLTSKVASGGRLNAARALDFTSTPPKMNTVPIISDPAPAKSSTVRDRTPTIRAKVRDAETSLTKGNMKLYVDNQRITTFTYYQGIGKLTYKSRKLSLGRHTVKVVANDGHGLGKSYAWRFKVAR